MAEYHKTCIVPGCGNKAETFKKSHNWSQRMDMRNSSYTSMCRKHYIKLLIGILDRRTTKNNKDRSVYRQYMKPPMNHRYSLGNVMKKTREDLNEFYSGIDSTTGKPFTRRQIVEFSLKYYDVDHKDGNHENNDPENLQTICAHAHRIKTILNGDNAYG